MSWSRLKPEEKVALAVGMVDVVTRICTDSVKEKNPSISDVNLIRILRRRFQFGRKLLTGG